MRKVFVVVLFCALYWLTCEQQFFDEEIEFQGYKEPENIEEIYIDVPEVPQPDCAQQENCYNS